MAENEDDEGHEGTPPAEDSRRLAWAEGPDEGAPEESWRGLGDDELLQKIETLDPAAEEDERLLDVVTSHRHFFIRQEAAKRVRDRRRLYAFEDDRHVGQILVRHLSRREDLSYLERISMLSRHVEVRKAAQVQLARVWQRIESPAHDTRPVPRPTMAVAPSPPSEPEPPAPREEAPAPVAEGAAEALPTSAPLEGGQVDGSLLSWAIHFLVEAVWTHLGTAATKDLLHRTRARLLPRHPTLSLFTVSEDARVKLELTKGPRLPTAAVRDLAAWMAEFRRAARLKAPAAPSVSVRASTNLMADALRAVGFYGACDEADADLGA